jgi:hypothetical protein
MRTRSALVLVVGTPLYAAVITITMDAAAIGGIGIREALN